MSVPKKPAEMSILFDLWMINHLLSGALDEVLVEATGLTGEDFGFYSLIRRFGPVTPGQVARWTAMPATTVSATVRRLSGRGHVEQVRNPADGRSRLIALTDAGVATHSATASVYFAQTRDLAAALGPDEERQRLSLQRLDGALRQVSGLDPRPYAVRLGTAERDPDLQQQNVGPNGQLSYRGEILRPDEEDLVRSYIDFVRGQRK